MSIVSQPADVYEWVEHTSELELAIEAASEADVFADALAALAELIGDTADRARKRHTIDLEASVRATLRADWLAELAFLAETEGFVPERLASLDLGPRRLSAAVDGRLGYPPHLVKAVTYHNLVFEPADGRWRARVVLDV